ncbi:MAG TPA: amino acid adenylation domain-containing protein [Thermoanaerobaculia bacterium]|nr:amino acid adenylation domain-containing protein [Thermoanaerobaculia bacterium]
MVENRGMLNHLWAKIEDLGLTAAEVVAQTASAAFDISVWQFLAALVAGGRVVVLPDEIAHDPSRLLDRVEAEGITVLETVPSLLGGMLDLLEESDRRPALAALRWMIPTGEALPPALARRWLALYPGIPLLNAYGPTECSDDVSHFRLAEPPLRGAAAVSVGRPVRNLRLHVVGDLAAGLAPLPISAVGELAVSGMGVGRGYRDDPRRTAEMFVPDPFTPASGEPGARLYRTGDLARLLPDGTVDFLGRRDHQVKVRGFRIEIGEIEAALLDQPAVREAVVAVRGEGGAKRLAAYVVARDEQAGQELVSELRAALSERLPEAMVPADWVLLPALPLTSNGKVDRRALPDPEGGTAAAVYVAPGTPLESLIAELWTEVLGPVRFGVHDSFFDLGGDSIKGAVFVHRLQRRLQSVLYVATLFDRPTIAGLAQYLAEHYAEAVARLEGAEDGGLLPGPRPRLTVQELERFRALIPPLPEGPAPEGKNPAAVFLLSPPRAGSTLLRVLLAGHPQLFAPPELELLSFHTLAERRDAFTGRNRFWLEGALRALVQIHGWSPEEAAERMAEYERQGLSTRRFYRLIQEWIGDRMLVDKTPSYALDPAVLRQAEEGFEGARYIHLVRHPSASILSFEEARLDQVFFRHPHSYPPRQLAELIWTVSQENILSFLADVPAERQHRVVFEDLVGEPRPVLEGICDFLGLPYHSDMERPYADSRSRMTDGLHEVSRMLGDVKFHEHREVDPAAAQRWRFQVSEDELGAPTREVASRLGYDMPPLLVDEPEDARLAPLAQRGEQPVLSFAQERLWFLHQLDPEGATYNMPQAFRLVGPLDEAALQGAFREVLRRHEMLRTRFALDEGRPVPVVAEMASLPERVLLLVDLAALGAGAAEEARRLARQEALRPFDLERGPVVRGLLMRLGPQDRVVVFVSHHIACDGWSMGLWAREIETLYTVFSEGRPSPLPDPPAQYADFAAWQRSWLQGSMLESQLAYWRERLRNAPAVLEIPLDRPRPAFRTSHGEAESWFVAPGVAERLRSLSGRHNSSLFMTLLAVFQLHLSRLSGQEDILVGSPITGRTRPEAEGLIGCFLNTLALRTDLSGGPDFLELLRRVRESVLGAFSYQDVPFEKLLEELRPERDTSRPSLFQVLFNMLNAPRAEIDLPGLTLAPLAAAEPFAKFDLTLYVLEQGGGLRLELVYNADLFDRARMAEMLRQYQLLLEQIAERPEAPVAAHSLLTREAAAVLPDPAASLVHPWPGAVQDLFAAWARRTPEKVALSDRDGDWTYGELDDAVKRLAARLWGDGIRPGDRVAIYAHRSAALACALLGVLKAGAVFTILDPIYPAPRLIDRLNMAEPRGLLHLQGAGPLAPELAAYVEAQEYPCRLVLPAGNRERATAPVVEQSVPDDGAWPAMGPCDVASIAFTSGSTGLPKGIVQTHGSMSYFLPWHQEELGFTADDRHTMLSGLAHDPLHRDTFYCLGTGATLFVPDPDRIGEPGYLAGWMKDRRVTITNMTPAMGKLLAELPPGAPVPDLPDLRVAILAGDLLTREVVAQIRRLAPNAVFLNVYGATESQRALSFHVVEEERGRRLKQTLPIGKGKTGSQLLVLTASGLRAGIGELGEVVIRSPHLAQGYLKDEAQTRAKYGTNPFTGGPADRIYRTGDLGRYLPDGDVEAAGRADQQVKIRGFRVEPGEVEAELLRAPGVKETVVVARSVAPDGERQLVAYLVLDPNAPAEISDLRERLRQTLPAYMVPSAWVVLEKLSVNPNGKIDRPALPSPEAAAQGYERRAVPPRDDLERRLAGIWEEVLGTAPVGVTDDFFDLGGHSLMAVRLMARIESEMGRTLPLSALFQTGTVEGLAALLRRSESREASPLVTLRDHGSKPPLFLVHPLGGQVLAYAGLVRLLDPGRPAYGLQDVAPPGAERTIAGLAAAYVEQVRSVQPEGPYHLAGWSLGGRIAFEMACQLAAQGQETAFLGLIDTGLVAPPERPDQKDGAVLLREILWAVPSEFLEELRPGLEDPLGVLLEELREAGQLPAGFDPEIARRHFQVLQEHLDIARRYRPQPFAGRLTFFAAEEQPSLGEGIALDPTHGWGAFATETDLLRLPGDHVSMMHNPAHLEVLAEALNASLERAENP